MIAAESLLLGGWAAWTVTMAQKARIMEAVEARMMTMYIGDEIICIIICGIIRPAVRSLKRMWKGGVGRSNQEQIYLYAEERIQRILSSLVPYVGTRMTHC
jgi:hypothetical protein